MNIDDNEYDMCMEGGIKIETFIEIHDGDCY